MNKRNSTTYDLPRDFCLGSYYSARSKKSTESLNKIDRSELVKSAGARSIYIAVVRPKMKKLLKGLHSLRRKDYIDPKTRSIAGFELYRRFCLRYLCDNFGGRLSCQMNSKMTNRQLFSCFKVSQKVAVRNMKACFLKWKKTLELSRLNGLKYQLFSKSMTSCESRKNMRLMKKCFNLWRRQMVEYRIAVLRLKINDPPKEVIVEKIHEIIKEVPVERSVEVVNKKSAIKSAVAHSDKLQKAHFLRKYLMLWMELVNQKNLLALNIKLNGKSKEVITKVEVVTEIHVKDKPLQSAYLHAERLQRNFYIAKYCRRWRNTVHYITLNHLKTELSRPPVEVMVEKTIIKQVSVETVKVAPNKKSALKKSLDHTDVLQKMYFIAKYCRRWRGLTQRLNILTLRLELETPVKEVQIEKIVEIPVENINKTEIIRRALLNATKSQMGFFNGYYFRKWRNIVHRLELQELREVLGKTPMEIHHHREVIIEVMNKKLLMKNAIQHTQQLQGLYVLTKFCRKWRDLARAIDITYYNQQLSIPPHEVIVDVPIIKQEIVEVVREVTNKKSIMKNTCRQVEQVQHSHFLLKYCRRWRALIYSQQLQALKDELALKPKELVTEVEVVKQVVNKKSVLQTTCRRTFRLQDNFWLARYCRKWRNLVSVDSIHKLAEEVDSKPKEIVTEITKEIPIIHHEFIEIINTGANKIAIFKNTAEHANKSQRFYFLGKYMNRWRRHIQSLHLELLKFKLENKQKTVIKEVIHEIEVIKSVADVKEVLIEVPVVTTVEVVKEVINKKSTMRKAYVHVDRNQNYHFLAKYCRRWRGLVYTIKCHQQTELLRRNLNPYLADIK
jgi:hypothetical protein